MIIFVTGFHRAGTHSLAKYLADKHKLHYIKEGAIRWDSFEAAKMLVDGYKPIWEPSKDGWELTKELEPKLKNGFVLQCPGLAHMTKELSEFGEVYWSFRDRIHNVTAMRNAGIGKQTWHIMNQFKGKFPDDIIWSIQKYDGSKDPYYGFIIYYSLLIKIKTYFFEKYFAEIATRINLEETEFYDESKSLSHENPITEDEKKLL